MIHLWRIFFIVLTTTSFHIRASEHRRDVERTTPTGIRITPFQLEIRAQELSLSQEQASVDLKSITEDHLTQYIKNQSADTWKEFDSISLFAEEEDIDAIRKLRRLLRINNYNDSKRQQQELIVRFKVMYSGTMMFLDSNLDLPTREQCQKIVLDAFVGQGKLDFLNLLQESSDEFLSATSYAKAWIPVVDDVNEVEKKSGDSQWFLICSITAFAITVAGALYYIFCCCKEGRGRSHKRLTDDNEDLSNTKNRSEKEKKSSSSPNCIKPTATRSLSPPPKRYSSGRTYDGGSIVSKATIDMNGSVDMIAWNNNKANTNAPFETDITMITNASPNKTIEVEIPRQVGGRSKTSRSLSRNMLNQHNGMYYDKRSRRTRK